MWTVSLGGKWQLRIDDIDPPRAMPGAVESITRCLQAHGLHPDGQVHYQSNHHLRYDEALKKLHEQGDIFHCICTRATLAPDGSCREGCAHVDHAKTMGTSLRVKVPEDTIIEIHDGLLGHVVWPLGEEMCNFIVRRRDGLYAYQLAAAVDDALPNVTQVIRGRDLLDSTPRQIFLQQRLGLESPQYGHLPVLTDDRGFKLSKQTGAPALDINQPLENLRSALAILGQPNPPSHFASATELLAWSLAHWDVRRVPR